MGSIFRHDTVCVFEIENLQWTAEDIDSLSDFPLSLLLLFSSAVPVTYLHVTYLHQLMCNSSVFWAQRVQNDLKWKSLSTYRNLEALLVWRMVKRVKKKRKRQKPFYCTLASICLAPNSKWGREKQKTNFQFILIDDHKLASLYFYYSLLQLPQIGVK